MNTPEIPLAPPPLPRREHFKFEPMQGDPKPLLLLENLLKHPGRIIHTLHRANPAAPAIWFLLFALGGMALYGLAVGSLTGGMQLWIAPAKLVLGTLLSVLICLLSLSIFSCLGGSDIRLRAVAGGLAAAVCLSSLLLIGFAPVAWIFSQSTNSVAFMGTLHLLFWCWIVLRPAPDRRDEPLSGRENARTCENLERDFYPRLPADDHYPASNHRPLGSFFGRREEVLPHPLARLVRRKTLKIN
jgi:hypothetical protein